MTTTDGDVRRDPSGGGTFAGDPAGFLYHECRLLDERRFDDWLALFDDDCSYEIPYPGGDGSQLQVSIARDDSGDLAERVWRLHSGDAFAQNPPSRTSRMLGNLQTRVRRVGSEEIVEVSGSFILAEVRRDVQRIYAGRSSYDLVAVPDGFRIRRKRVDLVNADAPLGNLTFIL